MLLSFATLGLVHYNWHNSPHNPDRECCNGSLSETVDLRLLLTLLNAYGCDSDLESALAISKDDLSKIVNGGDIPWQRTWDTMLPVLVKKLDIPSLYAGFKYIRELWLESHAKEHSNIAMSAVECVVMGTWGKTTVFTAETFGCFKGDDGIVRVTYRVYQKDSAPYSSWTCIHISNVPLKRGAAEELLKRVYPEIAQRRDIDEVSFVFTDWDEFNTYCPIIDTSLRSSSKVACKISVMYANADTREIETIY